MNRIGIPLLSKLTAQSLISAFYYDMPADFHYDGEQHAGWEFVYVEQGQVRVQADEARYILGRNEMVCHKPMEFHRIEPYHGQASIIIICFQCQDDAMRWFNNKILSLRPRQKQYLNDIIANANLLLQPKDPLSIARDGAMDRALSGTVAHEQAIKNTIELLMLSLMESETTDRRERMEQYRQYLHRRSLSADVVTFLEENLSEPLRLESLEGQFPYSLSSIRRIFKDEMGTSIMAYLTELRMEQAKKLLHQPGLTIEAVAMAVGYSNIHYFSNAFKNRTGKSPTAYRNENIKKEPTH